MYYSMYIYTHTVGYCKKPGEAETWSTVSLNLCVCKGTWSIASHRQTVIVRAQNQQGTPWSRASAQAFSASSQLGFRDFAQLGVDAAACRRVATCAAIPGVAPGAPAAAEHCPQVFTSREEEVFSAVKKWSGQPTLSNSWIVTCFSPVGWVVGKTTSLWVTWPFRSTVRVTSGDCFQASRLLCSVPGYETWGAGEQGAQL